MLKLALAPAPFAAPSVSVSIKIVRNAQEITKCSNERPMEVGRGRQLWACSSESIQINKFLRLSRIAGVPGIDTHVVGILAIGLLANKTSEAGRVNYGFIC